MTYQEHLTGGWIMERPELPQKIDDVLLPLLKINEQELRLALNEILVVHAEPIIRGIVRNRITNPDKDAEDIHSEIVLQLLRRLNEFTTHPQEKAINDFSSYVAVVTHNACNEYFRRRHPERYRLKKKLYYLLKHQPMFAIWESVDGESLCGFQKWRDRKIPVRTEKFQQLKNDPQSWKSNLNVKGGLAEFVNRIFVFLQNPLLVDDLVGITATFLNVQDRSVQYDPKLLEQFPDTPSQEESPVDQIAYLTRLWSEIQQLPLRQRKALILNLRDNANSNVILLFPHTGVASIREIASALEIPAHIFAPMWSELPMEDAKIATLLNLTRQQVINLRKSARERLARRMKDFEENV
jgi:RNA polymerase sigma factor (sigma-70 family)